MSGQAVERLREEVAAAARVLAEAGLLIGTAGNVSARAGDLVAVTATGAELGACTAAEVTVLRLGAPDSPATGHTGAVPAVVAGGLAPTSELTLHLDVYAHDPGVAAVVHTHAPYATAAACVLDELPVLHYQQLALGGAVRVAPYATFSTPELAAAVRTALQGRSAALMANHGSVSVGPTLDAAVENARLLEWLCQLHHRASALGTPRALTEDQQSDVVRVAIERSYGATRPLTPEENR